MHRFYAFHSFTHFHRNGIAAASLFLAAKVEEQPRKLEHVIKAANKCLSQPTTSTTDSYYIEQAQDLVFNENVLLQTLGFDVAIDHPHTHVVKTCHLVKGKYQKVKKSYFTLMSISSCEESFYGWIIMNVLTEMIYFGFSDISRSRSRVSLPVL